VTVLPIVPHTCLRESYERVRALPLADQVEDCVDALSHPEVIVEEMVDALGATTLAVRIHDGPIPDPEPPQVGSLSEPGAKRPFFFPGRDITVLRWPRAFTCLAVDIDPLSGFPVEEAGLGGGLDFAGLTCDATATPVLGGVQSARETSAYPLLLRLLACLTEIAPEGQLKRLNGPYFRDVVRSRPGFDLNLVLWEEDESPAGAIRNTLTQLTRDLAERMKREIHDSGRWPELLRDVVCLRMNPKCFGGGLRYEWHV
jgi:hypothetical protein